MNNLGFVIFSLKLIVLFLFVTTEKIRTRAPGESDWWKGEDGMEAPTEDDTSMLNSSNVSDSMDGSITAAPSVCKSSSSSSTGADRSFHNCGLETWEAARAAWTAKPESSVRNTTSSRQTVNHRELSKVLAKASSLRTVELGRRIPLKDLVESYVCVWNGSDDM